ncbi:hypothetical protein M9H77_24782 [Catharanthus roseus]|uniref:Uncharacterized protein n=1 Tax=Catharanthus roseus TaxID=4058 RepID=A0ACC0A597_CATRO|nr:hypothetical protein M9H77_24782 [Catharanthus roseus]
MSSLLLKTIFMVILFSSSSLILPFIQVVVADRAPIRDPPETDKYTVHVISNLPSNRYPLRIHCASGDDDLGYHNLSVNQDFNWSFRMNFRGTTLFFCHFWWKNEDKAFEVFNHDISINTCRSNCYWLVRDDGFYFTDDIDNVAPEKYADWWKPNKV